jgi:hypothetical protein
LRASQHFIAIFSAFSKSVFRIWTASATFPKGYIFIGDLISFLLQGDIELLRNHLTGLFKILGGLATNKIRVSDQNSRSAPASSGFLDAYDWLRLAKR